MPSALKRTGLDALTARQREILRLIARHHKMKEVGRLLEISPWTVRDHLLEVRSKLQVKTTREAVLMLMDDELAHAQTPPPAEGPLPQGTGAIDDLPPASGHGRFEHIPTNAVSRGVAGLRGELGGLEGRLDANGIDGATEGRSGYRGDMPAAEPADGGMHHLHDRGSDRLADGGITKEPPSQKAKADVSLQGLQRWLKTAKPLELVMFIGALMLILVLIVGGVMIGVIGTLESLQVFFHPPAS